MNVSQASAQPFGAGKFSETFLVRADSAELVLRIAPPDDLLQLFYEYRMMRQEPELHRLIRQRTNVPIPEILAHDFTRARIDRDCLIMNRLAGSALSEVAGRLSPDQLRSILTELGRCVAKLHAVHGDRHGYVGPHEPMVPQASWPEALAVMWRKLLDDCVACGVYGHADHLLAMRILDENLDAFDAATPASLCHMDLWAANVLVDQGRFSALFDFDRACYGDRENDLAVAEYCGLTTEPFWRGYAEAGGAEITPTHEQQVRRLFYLLYEHAKYIVISMSARRNSPHRAKAYADDCRAAMDRFIRTGRPVF
ncbi:MAG: aminoglycoside phosphotransferase family protein [Phycisphaerae bacterium]|nr:aminoglycoside phosphotransferase family protein [Phycisphaerae bacterium]